MELKMVDVDEMLRGQVTPLCDCGGGGFLLGTLNHSATFGIKSE